MTVRTADNVQMVPKFRLRDPGAACDFAGIAIVDSKHSSVVVAVRLNVTTAATRWGAGSEDASVGIDALQTVPPEPFCHVFMATAQMSILVDSIPGDISYPRVLCHEIFTTTVPNPENLRSRTTRR